MVKIMNKQHYDLIVIGGGSGGLAVAEKAADSHDVDAGNEYQQAS